MQAGSSGWLGVEEGKAQPCSGAAASALSVQNARSCRKLFAVFAIRGEVKASGVLGRRSVRGGSGEKTQPHTYPCCLSRRPRLPTFNRQSYQDPFLSQQSSNELRAEMLVESFRAGTVAGNSGGTETAGRGRRLGPRFIRALAKVNGWARGNGLQALAIIVKGGARGGG